MTKSEYVRMEDVDGNIEYKHRHSVGDQLYWVTFL